MHMDMSKEYYQLSLSQQNILNLERALAGTSVNNISTTVRIRGRLDFALLSRSINLVLESDSTLRTRIVTTDSGVMQYQTDFVPEEFPVFDFTNTSAEGIESWENAVTREALPLESSPLYRFILFRDSETSGGILVKIHHIIADGWSQIMLCNKIGKTYLELMGGKDVSLEVSPDYRLHIKEEEDYLQSKAFARDEKYWREVTSCAGEPSSLKSVGGAAVSPVGKRLSFNLPQVINHAIFSYCQEKRVAPFAVFYMALAIYFKRNGGADRFTVGVPIFNRTSSEFKKSTGMFVTTLPFFNEINDEWSLNEFNEDLAEKWYEMLRHQRYPFTKISELVPGSGRLFNIALSYQDSKIYESRDASVMLSGRWHYCGYQAEQLTIHLTNLKNHQQYAVDYDYLAQFFTEEDITQLHRNLCHILVEALSEPDRPIWRLNVLSIEEKEKLLYTFNDTDRYLEERSVFDALITSSRHYLNRVALIAGGERMTYGSLLHRGAQYAEALGSFAEGESPLAAIMLPRSFELVGAMVGAVQQECPYLILSDSLPPERVRTILERSGATVLVTDRRGADRIGACRIPVVTPADADECYGIPTKRRDCDCDVLPGDKTAYVVYTSGSTGEPKGVEISQRNLLNLCQEMADVYGRGAVLSICNVGFDAFMLESIVALINGRTIVFPESSDVQSPERLASLINGYAVGFIAITPTRLSALLRCDAFKNVMWRMESIVCGGEQFPPELLKRLKTCTTARIYNQYGPSETTVAVSMKELSSADKITVGPPMGNCKMYVLDRWMNPLPIGGNGRLYVGGKCVGKGYRNRPDLTDAAFRSNPFISDDRIYDTGDLAYWTPSGEIVLTGRADRQVKLRGLRIELQEVASCVESYSGVQSAYARICEVGGQQLLGVYYCSDRPIKERALLSHVATYLPDYMIPSFIIRIDEIPLSPNGKTDESRLPLPSADCGAAGQVTPSADVILGIFKRVLKRDDISHGSDYFLSGGNSLNAMECLYEIEKAFSRRLRVADLSIYKTPAALGAFIDGVDDSDMGTAARSLPSIKKCPKASEYPLTPIQQGIYVQSALAPDEFIYNMPGAFRLESAPDVSALENAFKALVQGDPIFRTYFTVSGNGVCARILDSVDFSLQQLNGDDIDTVCRGFLRPFDLSRAPLLRAGVWTSPEGEWYLLMDSHHIIGDGMSTAVLLSRLDEAYRSGSAQVKLDFYDYVSSAPKADGSDVEYWRDHLAGIPEAVTFPSDFSREMKTDFRGLDHLVTFTPEESASLSRFCRERGVSEFALFTAAFGVLLSAASGSGDLVIGTPIAGRDVEGSADICGPFISTLPLRLRPDGGMTVREWLDAVRDEINSMLDHRGASAEDIISALNLPRGEQNALYRVMITESPVNEDSFTLGGAKMKLLPISTGNVKMDMILELARSGEELALRFSYRESLLLPETVAFYGRCMKQILRLLTGGNGPLPGMPEILSEEDRDALVDGPNYSFTPFFNRPVHSLLRSVAARRGDDVAVICRDEKYSFSQLEARASAVADFIDSRDIPKDSAVALCLSRGFDMIAAMYGVLKSGHPYVFILDSFPASRVNTMLDAAGANLMLVDPATSRSALVAEGKVKAECAVIPEGTSVDSRPDTPDDGRIANVLFTSGSTGNPKGVMLRHRSVSNLYGAMKSLLATVEGNVLCSTNCVFDCFVVETLIALALGRCVIMADDEEMMLPWKLARLIETYRTGVFEMTPSRLRLCLGNESFRSAAKYINIVLLGGEAVSPDLVEDFCSCSDGMLMNMYGPTEATVFTTMCRLLPGEHITVGRPLQNTRTYVLDENRRPVLPTACGEMYIAGECLSAGYASNPGLTAESYYDDVVFPGEKMYKSGDLVRMRVDGSFDYIGRRDDQVKLNGQRIEMTEISGAMYAAGAVTHASTVCIKREDGSVSDLYGFFVPAEPSVTEASLKEGLSRLLPPYMVPTRLISLEAMPMTATNKIDNVSLRRMAEEMIRSAAVPAKAAPAEAAAEATVAPVVEAAPAVEAPAAPAATKAPLKVDENYVISVWERVLGKTVESSDTSFFGAGATSIAALSVLSAYHNDGLEMSLSQFYEHNTPAEQARILALSAGAPAPAEEPVTPAPAANIADTADSADSREETPAAKRTALITGATGFFGAHLLHALAETGKYHIICLLRDGSSRRLMDRLEWYFGKEEASRLTSTVSFVCGDVSLERLGLSEKEYELLASDVSEVYHSAADVRHFVHDVDSYMKVNVGGTEEIIRFARRAGATLYHMSTCSVAGERMKDGSKAVFTESHLDIGQVYEENVYVRSKLLAEKAVMNAVNDGLDAKIFRLGRLVGRNSDGRFQPNPRENMFYLLLSGFNALGAIPAEGADKQTDVMPVDVAARQVLLLRGSSDRVFHIMNGNSPTVGEIFTSLDGGNRIIPMDDFRKLYVERAGSLDPTVEPLIRMHMFSASAEEQVTVSCDATVKALADLGYIEERVSLSTALAEFGKKGN